MSFNKKQTIINISFLICILFIFWWSLNNQKNVKWVDIKFLYENFDLKKELENKLIKSGNQRKQILDSLEIQIRYEFNQLNPKDKKSIRNYEFLKENYLNTKQKFEEDDLGQKMEYEKQITNQLNQYVKDYALEQKIDILLGADGNGVLMYASEGMNETEEVLTVINNKYEGKN